MSIGIDKEQALLECLEAIAAWTFSAPDFTYNVFSRENWGNGWQWRERYHAALPERYRVLDSTDKELKIGYSYSHNKQPALVARVMRDPNHPESAESLWKKYVSENIGGELAVPCNDEGKALKNIKFKLVRTYKHYYSGSQMLELAVKLSPTCRGTVTINLSTDVKTEETAKRYLNMAYQNRHMLAAYSSDREKFRASVDSWEDWGGGWQWEESRHNKQPAKYRLSLGSAIGDIDLRYKYNPNHSPENFAYWTAER